MVSSAREYFEALESQADPARLAGITNSYVFKIDGAGQWKVDVNDGTVTVVEDAEGGDVTVSMSEANFLKIQRRELNPTVAFMTRKMKVKGDARVLMNLNKLLE